jgi:hypothetical protein
MHSYVLGSTGFKLNHCSTCGKVQSERFIPALRLVQSYFLGAIMRSPCVVHAI